MINPAIFHDYDVRAVVPDELDRDGAARIGQTLAEFFHPRTVAIGHDVRLSTEDIHGGLITGLLKQGVDVVDLGIICTDMVYFAAGRYGYDLAISVSASHNPAEYNGFKLVKKGAIAVSGDSGLYQVRDLAVSDQVFTPATTEGRRTDRDLYPDFIEHCLSFVDVSKIKPLKVVVDAGNSVAGYFMPKLAPRLPIRVIPLFFELDGHFPNHTPNPLKQENIVALQEKVVAEKADLGIAFDGDGDRMYLIDEGGKFISGTVTTAMIAEVLLKKTPGATILYNAVTGRIVPETVAKLGGKSLQVRVGHTLIKENMRRYDALFAGEHSAHYYFRENYYADSAVIAMLIALELISLRGHPIIAETNFEVADKMAVMKSLAGRYQKEAVKVDWLDGVTLWFKDSWVNVRPSNTQPLLRLNIEADDNEILAARQKTFVEAIVSLGGALSRD